MWFMDLSTYRVLWKNRPVVTLLGAALLARLPVMASMIPVSFLAKDAAGNFGWAGVVAGAYSIGTAVASVVWSRMADVDDQRRTPATIGEKVLVDPVRVEAGHRASGQAMRADREDEVAGL